MVAYAELTCQSAFSFQQGASEPEALVERARELGYRALALTDRDGLYGSPRHHAAARACGLHAVHGATLTLARSEARLYDGRPGGADDRVVLLAEDEQGWASLCRLVTAARHESRLSPVTPLARLLAAADGRRGEAPRSGGGLLVLVGPHLSDATLEALREAFGTRRVLLTVHDRLLRRDRRGQRVQRERARRTGLPLLVTGGARFARRSDKPVHDVLTCVRHKTTLDEAATRLLPNAEFCLRPVARIARLFRHLPEALERTVAVAERCTFTLDVLAYRFPPFAVDAGETAFSVLHRHVQEGARRRYAPMSAAVMRQLSRELDLIERMDLAGYFLVMHDIVRYCEREAILCQGRGSAANSAVCYALGITAVDPVGMDLLFERFLSEERGELPDIDLDIAHQDRERVLQYVYRRHGREHAAMAAEVVTYRARSAVRDAGKALGYTQAEVDALAKGIDRRFDDDRELPAAWEPLRGDPRLEHLRRLTRALSGLPRHLSIHVGGMIITGPPLTDLMPVEPAAMADRTVVPWDKDDLAALGIIKIDLLGLGMLTVIDRCLRSLNDPAVALSPLADATCAPPSRRAAEQVAEAPLEGGDPGAPLALHSLPRDDTAVWDMLCRADTVGVFQVESRAQMNCLPRLKPRCFYDLVVEVALIRPGPIQGDMVHPYLRRRCGKEPVTYAHPLLEPILERTLGVPLFQEQGMKIAVAVAGFTAGEADELRRAMGHKRSHGRMAALSRRLLEGMAARGLVGEIGAQVLRQLSSFADFGFPESHSASFAHLVWVSAWLKRYHPAAFLCALLNAQPMGFYPPAVLVNDARRHGVEVRPVDVLASAWEATLEWDPLEGATEDATERGAGGRVGPAPGSGREAAPGARRPAVRLGLCSVRGLGEAQAAGVRRGLASVASAGPFTGPEDFARRCGLGRGAMESLARLGALKGFLGRRRQALWQVARMLRRVPGPLAEPLGPEAPVGLPALGSVERMREDAWLGGVVHGPHPVSFLRQGLDARGVVRAAALGGGGNGARADGNNPAPGDGARAGRSGPAPGGGAGAAGEAGSAGGAPAPPPPAGTRLSVAGLVICRQRPQTAHGVTFVTLEDETGFANLVVTPPVRERHREALQAALILARGRVERAEGVVNLQVEHLEPLDQELELAGLPSHDYR